MSFSDPGLPRSVPPSATAAPSRDDRWIEETRRLRLGKRERTRVHSGARTRVLSEAIAVAGVGLFGAAVNAYYGPRGFMPLDHSVVFDGGWRTLAGQVPFRDYTTPNALTPSFLQALFFLVLGVTWKAYVLHATVFNGLFGILVYVLLRLCGGRPLTAVLYACLSGLVFYPPLGVPFHDQHAFFFVLLAITLAVAARRVGPRWSLALWTLVPFAMTAAALSKQTPTLLAAPVVVGLALASRASVRRALAGLAIGSVASVGVVVGAGFLAGVDWQLVWVYFVKLPLETGQSRGDRAGATAESLFVLATLFAVVGMVSVVIRAVRGGSTRLGEGVTLPLVLSVAFMLMCGGFSTLTLNEPAEGMPLFFASIGLFQIAVVRMLPEWPLVGRVSVASVGGALIATLALITGWLYNTHVDEPRSASNIVFDQTVVERDLPPALASMRFQVPDRYEGLHAADIRRVVSLLRSEPGSFVQVGDTTILNGLTGKPSVFPALFFSVGLTLPKGGTSDLAAFEQRLFDRLESDDVRRVVLERHTWEGASVKNLPRFSAWLERCRLSTRRIGFFDVIELSRRRGCAQAAAK